MIDFPSLFFSLRGNSGNRLEMLIKGFRRYPKISNSFVELAAYPVLISGSILKAAQYALNILAYGHGVGVKSLSSLKTLKVKSMVKKILNRIAVLFKEEDYRLDPDLPISVLLNYAFSKLFSLARCLFRGVVFSANPQKLIFLGPNVELKNKRMIHFGRGVILGRGVMIDGLSKEGIIIGDGASIGPYGIIRATGVLTNIGKGLKLGKNSSLDAFAFIGASGGVVIGSNVIMGQKVSFHSENHLYDRLDVLIRHQGTTRQGIVVEDDCWVGSNVTFLDGSHVASGCVIGAGSVVRGYIPPNSIVAGVPARLIKTRGAVVPMKTDE